MWKRLQHPNIVPFLGIPAEIPPFEIVCDWMDNDRITEYVRKNPEVDRIDLVSGFVSTLTISPDRLNVNFSVVGCGGWPPLPPLMQRDTW